MQWKDKAICLRSIFDHATLPEYRGWRAHISPAPKIINLGERMKRMLRMPSDRHMRCKSVILQGGSGEEACV